MMSLIMNVFTKVFEKSMNPMPNHCVECDKPTTEVLCFECMNKKDEDVVTKTIEVKNGKS